MVQTCSKAGKINHSKLIYLGNNLKHKGDSDAKSKLNKLSTSKVQLKSKTFREENPVPLTHPSNWSIASVSNWLDEVGLSKVKKRFIEEEIDGATLIELDHQDYNQLRLSQVLLIRFISSSLFHY